MGTLDRRVALVVGGSRGIGRAISQRLATEGAEVSVGYAHDQGAADDVVAAIERDGGRAIATHVDLADLASIPAAFDATELAFGPLDIVIANGATAVIKPAIEITEAEYDRVFEINTKGVFFVLREAATRINDNGRIVVTSTAGTRMLFPGNSVYLGSKGAVEQFVRTFAQELGSRGVTVNAVLPGFTNTELLPDRDRAMAAEASPMGRIGEPADVGDVSVLLCGDGARWITGQLIGAAGGVF